MKLIGFSLDNLSSMAHPDFDRLDEAHDVFHSSAIRVIHHEGRSKS